MKKKIKIVQKKSVPSLEFCQLSRDSYFDFYPIIKIVEIETDCITPGYVFLKKTFQNITHSLFRHTYLIVFN